MSRKKILLLLAMMPMVVLAGNDFVFSLKKKGVPLITMKVDKFVPAGRISKISLSNDTIYGCSVNGHLTRKDKNYLVRVILKDKQGSSHLIMEAYKEISDSTSYHFNDYGEESLMLDAVRPDSMIIIAIGADVQIDNINIVKKKIDLSRMGNTAFNNKETLREAQNEEKIDRINTYNFAHNKLWIAGTTPLSQKSYNDRKRIMGIDDTTYTGGEEYYYDGIFEIGDIGDRYTTRDNNSSTYVNSFDWREQHGKNWITSVKHQGNSGFCSAFTAISGVEAMTRLYYNQLLDIDLSEQEAACCNGDNTPWTGMTLSAPLQYIKNNGVCDEVAYPFVNDSIASLSCHSSEVTPNELISIGGYNYIGSATESNMKNAIINHGPLCSSIHYWWLISDGHGGILYDEHGNPIHDQINHAMLIVGYGQLEVGDTTYYYIQPDGMGNGHNTVHEGDPHIGMTYWIYKDNYGDYGPRHGYKYYIHHNYYQSVGLTYYIQPSIQSMNYTDNDILCGDADGDGYYFWGLGTKPSFCPSWVPDIADGDDANAYKGAMNQYGHLEDLSILSDSTTVINGNVIYTDSCAIKSNIRIPVGASLTIANIMNLLGRISIIIESGGELVINGGILTNAVVNIAAGGKLTIKNNGKLILRTGTDFEVPIGALFDCKYGKVLQSNNFSE